MVVGTVRRLRYSTFAGLAWTDTVIGVMSLYDMVIFAVSVVVPVLFAVIKPVLFTVIAGFGEEYVDALVTFLVVSIPLMIS